MFPGERKRRIIQAKRPSNYFECEGCPLITNTVLAEANGNGEYPTSACFTCKPAIPFLPRFRKIGVVYFYPSLHNRAGDAQAIQINFFEKCPHF